jgi:hypothetical protein
MKPLDESDPVPLEEGPLEAHELKRLRRMLLEQERASWLWRKLRIWVPIVGSAGYGLFHLADWAVKHYKP